ncbi:MDR-like ABC transporter [Haematococcus lacustris]
MADSYDYLLLGLGLVGAAAGGVLMPLFSVVFGDFVNAFGDPSQLDFMEVGFILVILVIWTGLVHTAGAMYLEVAMFVLSGNRQTNRLRSQYLQAVLRQDVAFFDTTATTGGLLQGLNEDSLAFQAAISDKASNFAHHACTFVAGFAIAFSVMWDMALVMLGLLPCLAAVGAMIAHFSTLKAQADTKAYAEAGGLAQQAIASVRTVAAFNGQESAMMAYGRALQAAMKTYMMTSFVVGGAIGAIQFVMFSSYAVAYFYGAHRVATGAADGGQVVTVQFATLLASFALGQAAPSLQFFARGRVSGARLFRVIQRQPRLRDQQAVQGMGQLAAVEGEVALEAVSFAYPARPDVLVYRSFSLVVPAGKTVALVGSSGSGKSTAVQLIERFYDPLSGRVTLDGVDLRCLSLTGLRAQVGLVAQEPTLFATTIYENIALAKPGSSQEEVQAAAAAANAHRFVSALPEGYQTQVGERGIQLSGGQKQRIAIARAVLKNPKVLLLDEATSALDTQSERVVQAALDRMMVGRTTLAIAHRLSTIRHADAIAVVAAGQVVELGSHHSLLDNPTGAYSNLVQLQMQRAGTEPPPSAPPAPDPNLDTSLPGSCPAAAASGEVVPAASLAEPVPAALAGPPLAPKPALTEAEQTKLDEEAGKKVPFGRLLRLNRPEWPVPGLGAVSSAIAGCQQPAFALLLTEVITVLFLPDTDLMIRKASFYAWMFFALGVGVLVVVLLQQASFSYAAQHLSLRVRTLLLRSLLYQEVAFFDDDYNSSGRLTATLATDAAYIKGANLTTLVFGYLLALIYDWRMALLITGAFPLILVSTVIQMRWSTGAATTSDKLYAAANQLISEAFSAIRVVHAYNLQPFITSEYDKVLAQAHWVNTRQAHLGGLAMGFSFFCVFALYGLIIWFGGWEVQQGLTTFGDMFTAFMAILLAAMGLAQAGVAFPDLGKAKAAVGRVFPLLDRQPAIDAASPQGLAPPPMAVQGHVQFDHVTFVYPSRPSVIVYKDLCLDIPAGKVCGLVGESGSGKSTVVSLLERFYDPTSGRILLDGQELPLYNIKWLRQQLGLVSQEPTLFAGSIADNIRYGCPEAGIEEVEAAAAAANAAEFIAALPERLNTLVGERGIQLSGGQKQRIAIARAVLKNPKVLLLDEATSALDARSESVVQAALDRVMAGRTCIVIAHRLSTIRHAHTINVVYRGAILEKGTHLQLLQVAGGAYARLVAAQEKGHEAGRP